MFLYYREKTGEVVMRSEGLLGTSLPFIEISPTEEEKDMMKKNYEMHIRNGRVIFEEPQYIKDERKNVRMKQAREDLVSANSVVELRRIILEIIKE